MTPLHPGFGVEIHGLDLYRHVWRVGDVLIWDERAPLHRGRPWPYAEPPTLASICVSARDVHGLDSVRP